MLGAPLTCLVKPPSPHERLLAEAPAKAEPSAVRGKDVTPFLLDYFHQHTGRTSLEVNLEVVHANCALGADIARSWSALRAGRT
jgi:pseudouridine-5'-phosphate glycosidase